MKNEGELKPARALAQTGGSDGVRETVARALYEWDAGINPEPSRPWPDHREHDPENALFYETFAGCAHQALRDMPAAERIALARELLVGTGMEVIGENGKQMLDAIGFTAGYDAAFAEMEAP